VTPARGLQRNALALLDPLLGNASHPGARNQTSRSQISSRPRAVNRAATALVPSQACWYYHESQRLTPQLALGKQLLSASNPRVYFGASPLTDRLTSMARGAGGLLARYALPLSVGPGVGGGVIGTGCGVGVGCEIALFRARSAV